MTVTGCYDDDGQLMCRATNKRVLSYREASRIAKQSTARGFPADAYHCARCVGWHYGHPQRSSPGRKRRVSRKMPPWRAGKPAGRGRRR